MNIIQKTAILFSTMWLTASGTAFAQSTSCNDGLLRVFKLERICAAKNAGMTAAEIQREIDRPISTGFTAMETKRDIAACEASSSKKFRRIESPPIGGPSCSQN